MHKVVVIFICFCNQMVAQEIPFDTSFYSLWEIEGDLVEITAQPYQQIFSVTSLPASIIENHVEPQVQTLLNQVSGIWMESGALNTNRISIRGVGNREPFATSRIKVYLDEIPITDGFGETSMEDIDPSILSRVQVWKNPASSIWGAGLGGMIHLQTLREWDPEYTSSFQIGSYGRIRTVQQLKQKWDKQGNAPFVINYNLTKQDGYRDNNEYQKHNLMFMQRWKMSDKFSVQAFGLYIDLRSQIPSSLGLTDFKTQPQMAARNWASVMGFEDYTKFIAGISFKYLISDQIVWSQSYAFNTFNSDELRPFNRLNETKSNFTIRQRISWQLTPSAHVQGGIEWFNESYDWTTKLDEDGVTQILTDQSENHVLFNGFLQLQQQFTPTFYGFLGLNLNTTSYDIKSKVTPDRIDYQYDPVLNPSIGVGYSLIPDKLHLIASLSKGFNPINIEDALSSTGQLNLDLKPESGWSTDLGIRFTLNKFSGGVTLYSLGVRNLIVQNRISEDVFESINAGKTRHQGMELEFLYQFHDHWQFRGAYALLNHKFLDFINGGDDFSGNELTGSPRARLFNQLSYENNHWNLRLDYWYTGNTPITDDGLVVGEDYHLMNLSIGYRFDFGDHWNLHLSGLLNNLFDIDYSSMYSINAAGFGSSEPRYYYPGLPLHWIGDLKVSYRF